MSKSILLALMFVFSHAAAAAAPALAKPAEPPPIVDSFVLLDPASKSEDRNVQLGRLQAAADKREPWAMYLLGTLFRLGDAHPANAVPRDLDKARTYLSNAAIQGMVNPMAGMAELEMEAHRPLDALTWTYIYLHYHRGKGAVRPEKLPLAFKGYSDGYDANLLERAMDSSVEAGIDRAMAGGYADAFIAKYDAAIQASLAKRAAADAKDKEVIPMTSNAAYGSANLRARANVVTSSTTAIFLFRFGDSGKPEAMVVEDILPGHRDASIEPLVAMARRSRIKPLVPGSGPKFVRIPVSLIADRALIEENGSAP